MLLWSNKREQQDVSGPAKVQRYKYGSKMFHKDTAKTISNIYVQNVRTQWLVSRDAK